MWGLVFDSSKEEVDAGVDGILATVMRPYLALYGTDLGPEYASWLTGAVPSATVETWDGLGHYSHLGEPDRFVARLEEFWQTD